MPRKISVDALREINSLSSGAAWVWLMKVTNPDDPGTPQYFVNNNVNVTSQGQEYIALAFNVELYIDDGDRLPTMNITLDNVTREFIDEVRTISTPLQIDLSIVNAESPDTVELSVPRMTLRNVSYDAQSITGILMLDDVLNQRFPSTRVRYSVCGQR
jgi:hypothetical protein